MQRFRTAGLRPAIAAFLTITACGCVSICEDSFARKKLSNAEWLTSESLSNYTMGLLSQGDSSPESLKKAIEHLERTIRNDPECSSAYEEIFATHFHLGHDKKAVNALERSIAINDSPTPHVQLAYQLAKGLIEDDQAERSIPYFRFVSRYHDVESGSLDLTLGELYASIDIPAEAAHYFENSIRRCPTNALAYLKLSDAYVSLDRADAAISILKKARRLVPHEEDILYALGFIHSYSGDYRKSVPIYESILSSLPTTQQLHPSFYLSMGEAYERTGRYREAEIVFEKCLEQYPKTHEVMNYLAYMWAEQGINLEKALEYSRLSLTLRPVEPAYTDTLGWIYFMLKRYPDAILSLTEAHLLEPEDPVISDHLGDAHLATNNPKKAVEYWTKSLMIKPGDKVVARKLKAHGINTRKIVNKAKHED